MGDRFATLRAACERGDLDELLAAEVPTLGPRAAGPDTGVRLRPGAYALSLQSVELARLANGGRCWWSVRRVGDVFVAHARWPEGEAVGIGGDVDAASDALLEELRWLARGG